MAVMRMRNALLAFKLQGAEGTAAAIVAADDAVKVENIVIRTNPTQTDSTELSGGLDMGEGYSGGMSCDISFDFKLAGSGDAAVAPAWGKILRAMGWAETVTEDPLPAVAEVCAAGSTFSATLGATAAATEGLYAGMPLLIGAPGAGTYAIASYSAAKVALLAQTAPAAITAASTWQIPPHVLYSTVSTGIALGTIAVWRDGVKWLFQDCRGGWSIAMKANGPGTFSAKMKGIYVDHVDDAVPTGINLAGPSAPVWKGGEMLLDGKPARVSTLTIDSGITPVMPDDPNAQEGFGAAEIVSRKVMATLDPLKTLVATRNTIGALRAGTKYIMHARIGSTAGNRFYLTGPEAKVMATDEQDRQGLVAENLSLHLIGANRAITLCQF